MTSYANGLRRSLILAASLALPAGCGDHDGVTEQVAPGLEVVNTVHSFNHNIGESPCPQKIGSMRIVNSTGEPVSFSLSQPSSSVIFDPSGGDIVSGSTKVALSFSCRPAASFDDEIVFEFRDADYEVLGTASIFVEGKVG